MAAVPSSRRLASLDDSSPKRSKTLSPASDGEESDVPIKHRSIAGSAVPPQEFMDQFSNSIRYRTLLGLFADLAGTVATIVDGGNSVNWPELTSSMRSRYHVSPPASMLLEEDNLSLLYKELQWSNRVETAAIQAHRDYTHASEAKRLALALLSKYNQWRKLEDGEGRRTTFQKYKDAFQRIHRLTCKGPALTDLTTELDEELRTYFDQGLHRKFPDVAKCYIPFFQKMYQQFDIPFPVSKGMSEIPTDMSAVLVPSSPAKVQQDGLVAPEALTSGEQQTETEDASAEPSVEEENHMILTDDAGVSHDKSEIPLVPESDAPVDEKNESSFVYLSGNEMDLDDSSIPEPIPSSELELELDVHPTVSETVETTEKQKLSEANPSVEVVPSPKGRQTRRVVAPKTAPKKKPPTRKNSRNLQGGRTETEMSVEENLDLTKSDRLSGAVLESSVTEDTAPLPLSEKSAPDSTVEDPEDRQRRLAPLVANLMRHVQKQKSSVPKEVTAASLQALKVYLTLIPPTDLVDYDPFKLSVALKDKDYTASVKKTKSISRFADPTAGLNCDTPEEQTDVSLMALNALAFNSFEHNVSEQSLQLLKFYQTYQKGLKRASETIKSPDAAQQIASIRQQRSMEIVTRDDNMKERPSVSKQPKRIKLIEPKSLLVKATPVTARKRKALAPQTVVVATSSRPARAAKATKTPAALLKSKRKQ